MAKNCLVNVRERSVSWLNGEKSEMGNKLQPHMSQSHTLLTQQHNGTSAFVLTVITHMATICPFQANSLRPHLNLELTCGLHLDAKRQR